MEFLRALRYWILGANPRTTGLGIAQIIGSLALTIKALPEAHTEHGQLMLIPAGTLLLTGVQSLLSADAKTLKRVKDNAARDTGPDQ